MAPSALLPEPIPDLVSSTKKYNDFRDDLHKNGYAVVKNVIPHSRAVSYQQSALAWLKSFDNPELDFSNPETWIKQNLPVQTTISTFMAYCVTHEKFMWDARLEPGVIDAFAKLWRTDELLVSFDALNITLPNRKDVPRKLPWEHIDQSPFRRGLHCVQGIIQLSEAGPEDGGLMVYPGSHKLTEEFFDTQTDKSTWTTQDFYPFKDHISWFTARGITPVKVNASPGDLILWDSRTIHYGAEPTEKGTTIRTIIYVAYTPARFASKEALEVKKEVFEKWRGTTHWPHDNLVSMDNQPLLDDGTVDPRDRTEPLEMPERSERLLKLAGVLPY